MSVKVTYFLHDEIISSRTMSMGIFTNEARSLLLGDGTTRPKLVFFKIEGVAEPVRIALTLAGIPFDDVYVDYFSPEWKSSLKFGHLPELTLPDGTIIADSMAMLRLIGEADEEGTLYPTNVASRTKIESALGLVDDLKNSWGTSLALSLEPERFGYPSKKEWTNKDFIVKKLRVSFVENDLPRFMEYFASLIDENGGHFLTGKHLTIADIAAYQMIRYFRRGIADHVPEDCLDVYPQILKYLDRVEENEKVAAYMASKDKSVPGYY